MNWLILQADERHGRSAHEQNATRAACVRGRPSGEAVRPGSAAGLLMQAVWPLVLLSLGLAGCGPKLQPEELGEILVDWRDIPGADEYVSIPELTPPGGRRSPEEMMRRMGMGPPEGMSFEEMKKMMEAQSKSMEQKRTGHDHGEAPHKHDGEGSHGVDAVQDHAPDAAQEQPQEPAPDAEGAGEGPAGE